MDSQTSPDVSLLIIDHDPDEVPILRRCLEDFAYRVSSVSNAREAASVANGESPDLIVFNGTVAASHKHLSTADFAECITICHEFQANARTGFLPVIMVVDADGNAEDDAERYEIQVDSVLVRPLAAPVLRAAVKGLLQRKRQYDAVWEQNHDFSLRMGKRDIELERTKRERRELSLLRDSIIANVSHELRTPLLQLKSAVHMLADDAHAGSPSSSNTLVDLAVAATTRLEIIVQNITQLAMAVKVRKETFRLSDAVQIAKRQLGRQWGSQKNLARIDIDVPEAAMVLADRNGVAQVLQQLIDNAIKFSPNGGRVEVIGTVYDDEVEVAVRDYGIGISKKDRDRIFQAFYQVDSSTTRPFPGAGVGLAIVKLLADAMGTRIEVQSKGKVGSGSTFSFRLPIATAEDMVLTESATGTGTAGQ